MLLVWACLNFDHAEIPETKINFKFNLKMNQEFRCRGKSTRILFLRFFRYSYIFFGLTKIRKIVYQKRVNFLYKLNIICVGWGRSLQGMLGYKGSAQ